MAFVTNACECGVGDLFRVKQITYQYTKKAFENQSIIAFKGKNRQKRVKTNKKELKYIEKGVASIRRTGEGGKQ